MLNPTNSTSLKILAVKLNELDKKVTELDKKVIELEMKIANFEEQDRLLNEQLDNILNN